MSLVYHDEWLDIHQGDARDVLVTLDAESVDCVVTSPPYYGLRDYGVDRQIGLEATPEDYVQSLVDVFREVRRVLKPSGTCWLNLGDSYAGGGNGGGGSFAKDGIRTPMAGTDKNKRPAWKLGGNQVTAGLKPKDLVGIPWRVAFALQADGWYLRSDIIWSKPNPMPESVIDRPTKSHEYLFLLAKDQWKSRVVQLSDSNGKRRHLRDDFGPDGAYSWAGELSVRLATAILDRSQFKNQVGLVPLDPKVGEQGAEGRDTDAIGGLPVEHRAAIWASRLLGADCSAEQFLSELHGLGITLSNRHNLRIGGSPTEVALPPGVYAYGQTAIAIEHPGEVRQFDFLHNQIIQSAPSTCSYFFDADAVREPNTSPEQAAHNERYAKVYEAHTTRVLAGEGVQPGNVNNLGIHARGGATVGRNIRSVWNIATRPYPGAHFAVFPPELPERCIKAGSSEKGVCPECGAPWERVVAVVRGERDDSTRNPDKAAARKGMAAVPEKGWESERSTTGWRPACDCALTNRGTARSVILDPFGGSGTVGMVANRLSRRAILIDLNPDYIQQQMKRNANLPLGLTA